MRELLRSIARENMRKGGIVHMNRKPVMTKKGEKRQSYFAKNWRKWIVGNPYSNKYANRKAARV